MNAKEPCEKILVIEDNPDFIELVSGRLRSWGYEVLSAQDGEEGLRVATEHVPDMVLLDILMPKIKGREVCVRLKANPKTAHIPVIFLTALGLPDHIKLGLELGAEDYIVKPFKPEELKERIKVCLARHRQQPQKPSG